jgi:allantoicase
VDVRRAGVGLLGLSARKARSRPGHDADLIGWLPDEEHTVTADKPAPSPPAHSLRGRAPRRRRALDVDPRRMRLQSKDGVKGIHGHLLTREIRAHMTEAAFTDLIDLAAERLGGAVLLANDEFFAPKESLLRAAPAVWKEGEYTDRGKWMDGWETRRRRTPGHDWCVVRLGLPGVVRGVVVDTAFFRGNYPEHCSLEGAAVPGVPDPEQLASGAPGEAGSGVRWTEILPRSPLAGDAKNAFAIASGERFTHLKLRIYPDGGVARLRVHGETRPDPARLARGQAAGPGGDGERRLRRGMQRHVLRPPPEPDPPRPLDAHGRRLGNAAPARPRPRLDDRAARRARQRAAAGAGYRPFQGQRPRALLARMVRRAGSRCRGLQSGAKWQPLLAETPLQPHARHAWDVTSPAASHVRLNIYPDGGVARLRVFGAVA